MNSIGNLRIVRVVLWIGISSLTACTGSNSPPISIESALGRSSELMVRKKYFAAINTCMKKEGFDYFLPPGQTRTYPKDPEKFIVEYGYGVVDGLLSEAKASGSNLNRNYINQLQQDQQGSYWKALTGYEDPNQSPESVLDPNNKSCAATATQNVLHIKEVSKMNADYSVNVSRLDSQSVVQRERLEWRRCVAKSGYRYRSRQDAMQDFNRRAIAVLVGGGVGLNFDLKNVEMGKISDLRELEVKVATIDSKCEHRYMPKRRALMEDLNRSFTDKYAKLITTVFG